MPITFEEVTADIEREPQERGTGAPAPAAEASPDIGEQIEQALRLRAERASRLCDL